MMGSYINYFGLECFNMDTANTFVNIKIIIIIMCVIILHESNL